MSYWFSVVFSWPCSNTVVSADMTISMWNHIVRKSPADPTALSTCSAILYTSWFLPSHSVQSNDRGLLLHGPQDNKNWKDV